MSRLAEAITWLGSETVLSLFVAGAVESVNSPPRLSGPVAPRETRSYHLDDPDRRLGSREAYEHDLIFDRVPGDLELVVMSCLRSAIDGGAQVAWFAFEGSFHFDHLLTRDIAQQIYAVADRDGIHLALGDALRTGQTWALKIEAVRTRLLA